MARIDRNEALRLLSSEDFLKLGRMADDARIAKHPENVVTFVIDRNINYTDYCVCQCRFCAFYKKPGDPAGYLLTYRKIYDKVAELVAVGGTSVLMQGGLHPDLRVEWFEELFRGIRERFPQVALHSLSPAEVTHIAKVSGLTMPETLARLKSAGLDSLPGGGAEVLVDSVRREISPNKIMREGWLGVMEEAHRLGMGTTATLMFGAGESDGDIVDHLLALRELQDRTGGFRAFIPWTFQPMNTELGALNSVRPVGAVRYLRVLALSRLVLDNFDNVQASWVTQGDKVAQVALRFGANDMGSTMLEENVVAAAGVSFRISVERLAHIIRDAGFRAAQRTTDYRIIGYRD